MWRIRWSSAVLGACLLFQGTQLAVSVSGDLTRAFRDGPAFQKDPGPPINFELSAFRTLESIAERLPEGARVLVVTPYPLPTIPWEYYFPRQHIVFLQPGGPKARKAVESLDPAQREVMLEWFEYLARIRRLWTVERQAEELRRADYLVELFPGLQLPRRGLELMATLEQTRLYRIDHEELK